MAERSRSARQINDRDLAEAFRQNESKPEGQKLEFKSSFLFDLKTYERTGETKPHAINPHSVAKTIAAFANSYGGILYVGVSDDRQTLGLERDYEIIKKYKGMKTTLNFDTGQTLKLDSNGEFVTTLHRIMVQLFLHKHDYMEAVDLDIFSINGKDVCVIAVEPSTRPLILRHGKGGNLEFYVRHTDQSEQYEDVVRFCEYWCIHMNKLAHYNRKLGIATKLKSKIAKLFNQTCAT